MNIIRHMNRKNKSDPKNMDFYPPHRHINVTSVPFFTAILFTTIIEDLIMKVAILSQMNNTLKIEKLMADVGVLRSLKYSVTQTKSAQDDLEDIDSRRIECKEYKLYKLVKDRKYLLDILTELCNDLVKNKSYQTLCDQITSRMDRDGYYVKLTEEERANRTRRRELYKQLRTLRNQHKTLMLETNQLVEDLKIRVEDQCLRTAIRMRYTEKWENARIEQHKQTIIDKQSGVSASGNHYKTSLELEQRAHGEVELLTNIRINELMLDLEQWMTKYDTDMENVDLKIQIKRMEYTDTKEKRQELEETIIDHDLHMVNWNKFKDDREAARLYTIKMQNAALAVQAWWRGVILRNHLGPYAKRPHKKGKHAKKNK